MKTLTVALGERSYPIFIGANLISRPECLLPYIKGQSVCIVSNDTIAPLYLSRLEKVLQGKKVDSVVLPDGESYKTLETLNLIFDHLLTHRHNRTTTLIALGGGVVGDITGFAAACYQRGINFIQIPTTLLSQVDSSVGGKTGVNHTLGKNMIGAFYQPQCVLADTAVLASLPDREFSAGMAEVIKYGLIADITFLRWLEENMSALMERDAGALTYAIERSCACKAEVVAKDEREGGVRAILNLGHTFGHAIETAQGYGTWLHGEAVAIGTVMAADLSARLGWLDESDVARVRRLLSAAKLPLNAPAEMTVEQFLSLMSVDKKVLDGRIRLVLLKALGSAVITSDVDVSLIRETILACQQ